MRPSLFANLERPFAVVSVVALGVGLFVAGLLAACGGIAVEPESSSANSSGATESSSGSGVGSDSNFPVGEGDGGVDASGGGGGTCGISSSSSGGGGAWSGTPPASCNGCECWIFPLTCLPDPASFAGVEDAGLVYGWQDVEGGLPAAECASLCGSGARWCAPETDGTPGTAIACHGGCDTGK